MKDILDKNKRLYLRSLWLIRLRWLAILVVLTATITTKYYYKIDIFDGAIYVICLVLVIENFLSTYFLNKLIKHKESNNHIIQKTDKIKSDFSKIKKIINYQILTDLLTLTFLLYFTGGVENPFIFFYFFHLAIASVLLSRKETYVHTFIALLLFLLLVNLSYLEIIPYHPLNIQTEYTNIQLYKDGYFIAKSIITFIATVFILVYLASSIGRKLQIQEEKYIEALEKLEEKDSIKNEYVLRVTHDLKGHLAAIQSNLSVLKSNILGRLDDKHEGFVERAYKRTFIATHFIRDLLKITKLRMAESIVSQPFNIKKILEQAYKNTKPNAELKNISLKAEINEDIGTVVGDEFSILEITSNLILNAIKYTQDGGWILLKAMSTRDNIIVSVIDNGYGVPADEQNKIFEEFYRASNVKKNVEDGTGIGLTIVKKVVEQHGGTINVESEPGKGSRFYYIIPKFLYNYKKIPSV